MPADPAQKKLGADDLLAVPEPERFHEVLDGELVRKAVPSFEHGNAQSGIVGALKSTLHRGWWIATEVEIQLAADQIVRPDVAGWRRERVPARPSGSPIRERPDWICEVLSPSNADEDTVKKLRVYQRTGVAHYWIVDPVAGTLTVYRWSDQGYVVVLVARRGERLRAEPFAEIELSLGALLGDDPES